MFPRTSYWLRHGDYLFDFNTPLSPTGLEQADRASSELLALNLERPVLISSPLPRAKNYAHIIGDRLGLEFGLYDELGDRTYPWRIDGAIKGGEDRALRRFLSRFGGVDLILVSHLPPIEHAFQLLGSPRRVEKGSIHPSPSSAFTAWEMAGSLPSDDKQYK